jgi:mannose-6-phosphate isomerase-like protein (cupin superfamily)
MKRNHFLKGCIAVSTFISMPFLSLAKSISRLRADKAIKVEAGEDRFDKVTSLFDGDKFFCKVSTTDTDGDMYIFESIRDKKGGPSYHYHFEQDEWWYILEGEFLFKVGDKTFTAKAGDSVFGPRMVPHAFAKTNDGAARMIIAFQPAGKMQECFRKISEGAVKDMNEEQRNEFRRQHGFLSVGPALSELKM